MSVLFWRGDAQGRAQVVHLIPANVEVGDRFTATINRKDITVTATAASVANVVALLVEAIGQFENDIPEFSRVSASIGGDSEYVIVTGQDDGEPFTLTTSTTDNGGSTVTVTVLVEGVAPLNEIQRVRLGGSPTGGTFTLTFAGQATGAIAYNANAATVLAALEALSNIAAGDVIVTEQTTSDWLVEFTQAFAEIDVPLMTGSGSSLTGGSSISVVTTQQGGPVNELQDVAMDPGSANSNPFTLSFGGYTTVSMFSGDEASRLQARLEDLPSIGAGNIGVTATFGEEQIIYRLEFKGTLGGTDVAAVTFAIEPAGGSIATIREGGIQNEKQQVSVVGGPTGGTFTLTFQGQPTAGIAYNADAATVDAALEALSNIGPGDVTVTGGPGPNTPWVIEFTGALASTDVQQMTGSGASLTGGSVSISVNQEAVAGVNEVQQVALGSGVTGGTFTITYDGETTGDIDYNATAGDIDTALEALSNIGAGDVVVTGGPGPATAWEVEFTTALAKTDVATMTGDGSGLTSAGSQALTKDDITTPTGPNWVNEPENYSSGALPIDGDIVFYTGAVDILWGLDQLAAITLAELHFPASFQAKCGLHRFNPLGFFEYRPPYFQIGATKTFIGQGQGSGATLLKLDNLAVEGETFVYLTGSADDPSLPTLMMLGTNADNVYRIFKGSFGLAVLPGEVSAYATLDVAYLTDRENDAEVWIGPGVTAGDSEIAGGNVEMDLLAAAAGDILASGGITTINGDQDVDLLRLTGQAYVYWNNTGALGGNTIVADEATLDFSQDKRPKTVTNPIDVQSETALVHDPHKAVTGLVVDYNFVKVKLNAGSDLGTNVRITRSAIA